MNVKITNENGTYIKNSPSFNASNLVKMIPEGTVLELRDDWDYEKSYHYKVGYHTEESSIYGGRIFIGFILKEDAEIVKDSPIETSRYLCNGQNTRCRREPDGKGGFIINGCYYYGGPCSHTLNERFAKNSAENRKFERCEDGQLWEVEK